MKKFATLTLLLGFVALLWFVRSSQRESVATPTAGSTPSLGAAPPPLRPADPEPPTSSSTRLSLEGDALTKSFTRVAAPDVLERVTVHATVEDTDGRPLGDIELVAQSIDGEPSVRSDASGVLTLVIPWETANEMARPWCSFVVRGEGVVTDRRRVEITAPGDVFLGRFELPAGGAFAGRVVDADGNPFEGAYVSISKPITDWSDRATLRHGASVGGGFLAQTDAEGRYRMGGLPVATFSVAARARGTFHSFTAPIDIVAGETNEVPDIALERAGDEFRIEGVALELDGTPIGGRVVSLMTADGGAHAGSRYTDSEGRFGFTVEPETVWRLRAKQPGGAPLVAYDVAAGTLDVVLQAHERNRVRVHVSTSDGATPSQVSARTSAVGNPNAREATFATPTGDGPLEIDALDLEFRIHVHADGYAPFQSDPFAPDDPPSDIEVTLVRVATWGGVVFASGAPVEGARVDFHVPTARGQAARFRSGLYTRFESSGYAPSTRTDADGRFGVSLESLRMRARPNKQVFVHAWADGYARSAIEVVALEPDVPPAELTLALTDGGSVEGRVIAPEGVDLRGQGIAISQADGHRFVQTLDATGAFRFDRLTPGSWLAVTGAAAELEVGTDRTVSYVRTDTIAWSFEIFDGEVTRFDLDPALQPSSAVRLTGRFLLNGEPPTGWSWSLSSRSDAGRFQSFAPDGNFEIGVAQAGAWSLSLTSPRGPCGWTRVSKSLELFEGENAWSFDLPSASLRITGLQPHDPLAGQDRAPDHTWVGSWSDAPEALSWTAMFWCAPADDLVFPQVPAGTLVFRPNRPFESASEERTIDLLVGEAGSIDLR